MAQLQSTFRLDDVPRQRDVLILSIPALVEMALHLAAWAVDTAMVGRLGAEALSAVGFGGDIYFTACFVVGALGVGAGAVVARATGARDDRVAARAGAQSLILALGLGAVLAALIWQMAPHIFRWVDLGEKTAGLGVAYMRTVAPAGAMFIPLLIGSAVLRARGDTRTPMWITLITNIINIVGDWVLIFGNLGFEPQGVVGAARALVMAQGVGCALTIFAVSRISRLSWERSDWTRLHPATMGRLIRVSLPVALESLAVDGARLANIVIIASLGPVAVAATQVAITAEALSFMPGYGFSIAAGVLAGQGLGAGRPDVVRATTGMCRLWALVLMGTLGAAFVLIPEPFVRLFTNDPDVIRLGAQCLRVGGLIQPFVAVGEVTLGSMRGMGDTRRAVLFTALGAWGLRVPLAYLMVSVVGLGVLGAWWAMGIEWIVRSLLVTRYFRRGSWERLQV